MYIKVANRQIEGQLSGISITVKDHSLQSYANELKSAYNYLLNDADYSKIAKKLEPFVVNVRNTPDTNIEHPWDIYSILDATIASLQNKDDIMVLLDVGKDIARTSGGVKEEDYYVSKIVKMHEENNDMILAFKEEKNYCYSKGEFYPTEAVFSHYVNILRLSVILGADDEINDCMLKIGELQPSKETNVKDVIASLVALSDVCEQYKPAQENQENIVSVAAVLCKSKFPWIDPHDEGLLDSMIS